jgi:hypothetical protein
MRGAILPFPLIIQGLRLDKSRIRLHGMVLKRRREFTFVFCIHRCRGWQHDSVELI